jgi:nucleoredoxin
MKTALLGLCLTLALPFATRAGALTDKLEGDLVRVQNAKSSSVEKGHLANKKVLAFYYSAHWCPPCRAFTPTLSKEYKELAAKYPEFELIFVSSDKDEKAMEEYMDWGKMDFPALKFGKRNSILEKLGAQGIPYLVVTDADGKELAGRGKEDWVHPSKILPELEKILKNKG